MAFDSAGYLADGLRRAGWSVAELWLAAFALGGDLDVLDIEGATSGLLPASPADFDVLVAALNERLAGLGLDRPMCCWADLPTP